MEEECDKEKELFRFAKSVEWDKIVKAGAVRKLANHELQKVLATSPERICGSRYVCTWKSEDGQEPTAKARWCVQGHGDADSLWLGEMGLTGAPTLSQAGKMFSLAVIAGCQWELVISDIAGAFLQTPKFGKLRNFSKFQFSTFLS